MVQLIEDDFYYVALLGGQEDVVFLKNDALDVVAEELEGLVL